MGKKYIVEVKEGERLYKTKLNALNEPVIREIVYDCEPYTAPDLEQVRKEEYDKGYADAKGGYENGFENGYENGFANGMIVAWDAARKIGNMPYNEEEKVFGSGGWTFIEKHTASEAIEKIQKYEQEKEKQDGLRQNIQAIVDQHGYSLDEIATVLEKMRGEQDG